jgi:tRNA pseudouridine55 synthase
VTETVICFDKPAGVTSHDCVSQVRRAKGKAVKVGHAGTLDPFATGLLLVLTGRATRTQRLFMALEKTYEVTARFGAVSTTGDRDGELTETGVVPAGDLILPTGSLRQRPPIYSALKVGGVRAYSLARAGVEFELDEREIDVHEFTELERSGDLRRFRIRCSSGTYVRSLIADLGDAYCVELRRTAIGPFSVDDEPSRSEITLAEALTRFLPPVALNRAQAIDLGHGKMIDIALPENSASSNGLAVALDGDLAVGVVVQVEGEGVRSVIGFPADYPPE